MPCDSLPDEKKEPLNERQILARGSIAATRYKIPNKYGICIDDKGVSET